MTLFTVINNNDNNTVWFNIHYYYFYIFYRLHDPGPFSGSRENPLSFTCLRHPRLFSWWCFLFVCSVGVLLYLFLPRPIFWFTPKGKAVFTFTFPSSFFYIYFFFFFSSSSPAPPLVQTFGYSNSNSKTLFYKDCSLGSVKNLSNN